VRSHRTVLIGRSNVAMGEGPYGESVAARQRLAVGRDPAAGFRAAHDGGDERAVPEALLALGASRTCTQQLAEPRQSTW
jgi:hypothetical protein